MTAVEYRKENHKLMTEYENNVRNWLAQKSDDIIADKIPYFRDGVVCPEEWFKDGNDFRPMIVLKEVSLGINTVKELDDFLKLWGNQKQFEFVENLFDDVRIGTFSQWRRIAHLLKGFEEIHNGASECDYYKYDFSFKGGGEIYCGDIEGYQRYNRQRTANENYNMIMNRMALFEVKKIGAGVSVGSELSIATRHFTEHIAPFKELMYKQIELINPTVIICCGRENGSCISELLNDVKENTRDRIWIDGYHHIYSSNLNFYEKPLMKYRDHLMSN